MRLHIFAPLIASVALISSSTHAYESVTVRANPTLNYPLDVPALDSGNYYFSYSSPYPFISARIEIYTNYVENDCIGPSHSYCLGENEAVEISPSILINDDGQTHYRTEITLPPLPPSYYGPPTGGYGFFCVGYTDCLVSATYTPYDEQLFIVFPQVDSGFEAPPDFELTISSVPEPSAWTLLMFGTALLGGVSRARRRLAASHRCGVNAPTHDS